MVYILVFIVLVLADQITKAIAYAFYGSSVTVIPGYLGFEAIPLNEGMSFGWLSGKEWAQPLLIGLTAVAVLAFLIAFLDFLPFFGTGTAMIPWAVYEFFMGDYKMTVALIVIYVITQAVHQLLQPKLVGDSVGLNPLVTLFLLYIGYRMGGILWMILAVPIGMVLINMCQAGAFDYIFDDVKILVDGILGLREEPKER